MPTDLRTAVRTAWNTLTSVLLYAVSFLVPRDEDRWAFGCNGGNRFAENSKYLFLALANDPETPIRPVWLTRRDDLLDELRGRGYEAYHADSLRGRYETLRAGCVFFTHSLNDVGMEAAIGSDTVNLWHGVPLKRVSLDDSYYRHRMGLATLIRTLLIYSTYRYIVVTADRLRSRFATAFNADESAILSLGYPRNDVLFGPIEGEDVGFDAGVLDDLAAAGDDRDLVLYAPTWRDTGRDFVAEADIDFERWNEWAHDHDATVLLKLHPATDVDLDDSYDRVVELPSELDIHPAMRYADVLVTDYSSVYFDYLLLDRPLVFFPFDEEQYLSEDRELYFDYDETTPGPKAESFEELLDHLGNAVASGDTHAADRERVRVAFFDHTDGRSAERVVEAIQAKR